MKKDQRDLFSWSEHQAETKPAEVVAFPSHRHARLEALARRVARYSDENRMAVAIRKEAVAVVRQRLDLGVPDPVAEADGHAFIRAAWVRVWELTSGRRKA